MPFAVRLTEPAQEPQAIPSTGMLTVTLWPAFWFFPPLPPYSPPTPPLAPPPVAAIELHQHAAIIEGEPGGLGRTNELQLLQGRPAVESVPCLTPKGRL